MNTKSEDLTAAEQRAKRGEGEGREAEVYKAAQCCGRVNAVSSALEPFLKDPRRQIGA